MIGSSVNVAEFFYVPFRVRHPDWTGADVFGSFDYGPALLLTPFPSAKPGSGHNVDHNWLGEAAERVGDRLSLLVVIDSRTLL